MKKRIILDSIPASSSLEEGESLAKKLADAAGPVEDKLFSIEVAESHLIVLMSDDDGCHADY